VIAWEIIYFKFARDFIDQYSAHLVEQVRSSGASQEAIQTQLQRMKRFKDLYNNPLFNAAITFLEPLPVGLIITLISSLVLRKKGTGPSPSREPAQRMAA